MHFPKFSNGTSGLSSARTCTFTFRHTFRPLVVNDKEDYVRKGGAETKWSVVDFMSYDRPILVSPVFALK